MAHLANNLRFVRESSMMHILLHALLTFAMLSAPGSCSSDQCFLLLQKNRQFSGARKKIGRASRARQPRAQSQGNFRKTHRFWTFQNFDPKNSATFSEMFWTERGKFPFEKNRKEKVHIWIRLDVKKNTAHEANPESSRDRPLTLAGRSLTLAGTDPY